MTYSLPPASGNPTGRGIVVAGRLCNYVARNFFICQMVKLYPTLEEKAGKVFVLDPDQGEVVRRRPERDSLNTIKTRAIEV